MREQLQRIKRQTGMNEDEIVRFSMALYSLLLNHSSDNTIGVWDEEARLIVQVGLTPSAVDQLLENVIKERLRLSGPSF